MGPEREKANNAPTLKKHNERNLQAIWPHHSHWKGKEKIFLGTISKHMKDKEITAKSQYGFNKGKSCPTNMIIFCDEVTSTMDKDIH